MTGPDSPHSLDETRAYYDEFSRGYEAQRRPNDRARLPRARRRPRGVARRALCPRQSDLLECGCGTGLLLERMARLHRQGYRDRPVAGHAGEGQGARPGRHGRQRDRSPLRRRLLRRHLPRSRCWRTFRRSASALAEMARRHPVRAGSSLPSSTTPSAFAPSPSASGPPGRSRPSTQGERGLHPASMRPGSFRALLPPGVSVESARGRAHRDASRCRDASSDAMRETLRRLETRLADTRLSFFGGFYVAVLRKRAS